MKQYNNNCRYNSFITIFYFLFSSFLKNIKEENNNILFGLNDLILKLSEDVNNKNYIVIIVFYEKSYRYKQCIYWPNYQREWWWKKIRAYK